MMTLVVALALSAPAPKPQPKKLRHLDLTSKLWQLEWGDGTGTVAFDRSGSFWCLWQGQQWIGSWRMENGKLHVKEARVPEPDGIPERPIEWSVILDPARPGYGQVEWMGRRLHFRLR